MDPKLPSNYYNISINEEDIESDALSESDESTIDPCPSDHINLDTEDINFEDDFETYQRFMTSLKSGKDSAGQDLLDEDDDEEDDDDYIPDFMMNDDGEDGEDEEEDESDVGDETIRVQKKELKDLLNDCFLTLAGQQVHIPYDPSQDTSNPSFSIDRDSLQSTNHTTTNKQTHPSFETKTSSQVEPKQEDQPPHISSNLLSTLIGQLFNGNKGSELTIDGLPLRSIRNIVARQMSMSLQLLVQILLQLDESSEYFERGCQLLCHLSNLRESAVKKAALLQMNMENVLKLRRNNDTIKIDEFHHLIQEVAPHLASNQQQQPDPKIISIPPSISSIPYPSSSSSNVVKSGERRVTRSSLINYNTLSHRSSSVFDLPILSHVTELISRIDLSKKQINQDLIQTKHSLHESSWQTYQITYRLKSCELQLREMYSYFHTKVWDSLIPTRNYPFPESFLHQWNPKNLTGRTFLTPAEDDLLLRGIIMFGENDFDKIKRQFLPSKESQTLCFYFTKRTSKESNSTAAFTSEDNDFKKYQRLKDRGKTRQCHDRWSPVEDLQLLRGYQIFGDHFLLLTYFFLPHKRMFEVKMRWNFLQKIWNQAFNSLSSMESRVSNITPGVRAFLQDINQSNTITSLQRFVIDGGKELQRLDEQMLQENLLRRNSHNQTSQHNSQSIPSNQTKPSPASVNPYDNMYQPLHNQSFADDGFDAQPELDFFQHPTFSGKGYAYSEVVTEYPTDYDALLKLDGDEGDFDQDVLSDSDGSQANEINKHFSRGLNNAKEDNNKRKSVLSQKGNKEEDTTAPKRSKNIHFFSALPEFHHDHDVEHSLMLIPTQTKYSKATTFIEDTSKLKDLAHASETLDIGEFSQMIRGFSDQHNHIENSGIVNNHSLHPLDSNNILSDHINISEKKSTITKMSETLPNDTTTPSLFALVSSQSVSQLSQSLSSPPIIDINEQIIEPALPSVGVNNEPQTEDNDTNNTNTIGIFANVMKLSQKTT